VIHDVVYNHLGPDGNYLGCLSKKYFSRRHKTERGEAITFDGLRLDATQSIFDASERHI
jgi:maltooligosyltrehalose trehalohydrolase